MLYRRRGENPQALARLSPDQYADLHHHKTRRNGAAATQAAQPDGGPTGESPVLFHVTGEGARR